MRFNPDEIQSLRRHPTVDKSQQQIQHNLHHAIYHGIRHDMQNKMCACGGLLLRFGLNLYIVVQSKGYS